MRFTDRSAVNAHNFPTADRLFVDMEIKGVTDTVLPANMAKPYKYSHFKYMGREYICGGTMRLFDNAGKPFLGILSADTVCGEQGLYRTEGTCYLPVHKSVQTTRKESNTWKGKLAYLITDDGAGDTDSWGVTDVAPAGDVKGIVIGRFVESIQFKPNGITWGSRFVMVNIEEEYSTLNSPTVTMPSVSTDCCFGNCDIVAFPEITFQEGRLVDINSNAFAENPLFQISKTKWVYTDDSGVVKRTMPNESFVFEKVSYSYDISLHLEATPQLEGSGASCESCSSNCCETIVYTVKTTPYTEPVCVPSPTFQNFRLNITYPVTTVATTRKFKTVLFDDSDPYSVSPVIVVEIGNETEIADAIKAAIFGAGFTTTGVYVVIAKASGNGDNETVSVIVSNTKSDLASLVVTVDGTDQTWDFGTFV
jgi:hypothetical protein